MKKVTKVKVLGFQENMWLPNWFFFMYNCQQLSFLVGKSRCQDNSVLSYKGIRWKRYIGTYMIKFQKFEPFGSWISNHENCILLIFEFKEGFFQADVCQWVAWISSIFLPFHVFLANSYRILSLLYLVNENHSYMITSRAVSFRAGGRS